MVVALHHPFTYEIHQNEATFGDPKVDPARRRQLVVGFPWQAFHTWMVGGLNSEKYEFVSWDDFSIPNMGLGQNQT